MKKKFILSGIVIALVACGEGKNNINNDVVINHQQVSFPGSSAKKNNYDTYSHSNNTTDSVVETKGRIDTTDRETFQQSVNSMVKSLSAENKEKFAMGILALTTQIISESGEDDIKAAELLKEKFNGKTAIDIIDARNK